MVTSTSLSLWLVLLPHHSLLAASLIAYVLYDMYIGIPYCVVAYYTLAGVPGEVVY